MENINFTSKLPKPQTCGLSTREHKSENDTIYKCKRLPKKELEKNKNLLDRKFALEMLDDSMKSRKSRLYPKRGGTLTGVSVS